MNQNEEDKMRLDKWLWAARFYKTRALAIEAVENGRVEVNQVRVKPAKNIGAGDKLAIRIGQYRFMIEVTGLSDKRGPATEAQKLYRETAESIEQREAMAIQIKAQQPFELKGRPTKRDRRLLERIKHGE